MKPILKFTFLVLVAGVLFHLSCKKEYSCEGCVDGNKPPIANAGPDQAITLPTDSTLLDGRQSSDPDGTISSFQWTKINGPASFTINNTISTLTVAKNLAAGTYRFELKVTDDDGLSAKDTVQIIVNDPTQPNRPPVANAGPDQTITLPTNTLTLDGSLSTDPDNNIAGYSWTKISGPASFNITNANAVQTTVTSLVQGVYQIELKVTDAGALSAKDTLQVIVNTSVAGSSLGCNASMPVIGHLPTAGGVKYSVTAGTKILFTRYPGQVDIYDTVTHAWETVNGMYATSNYLPEQSEYKTAKVGNKIIFSVMTNSLDTTQGQLVNIFDAVSNSWSITHLSQARSFYAMAVVGNKVFYAGGNNDSRKMDIYDAVSNSWSIADFNAARRNGMSAVTFGNKILFAGGFITRYDSLVLGCDDYGNNCDSVPAVVSTNRVDILDVSTNTWSVTHLSEGRAFMAKAMLGNKIIFAGGEKLSGSYSSRVDFYDVANGTWSSNDLTQYYGTEEVFGAYTIGNKLLLPDRDKIHIYDVVTNGWSVAQMPFPHQTDMAERGLVASVGNKLLFFLQYNDVNRSRGIDIYDASTNTWCHTQLNFDLIRTGMVAVGNRIFIAGGSTMIGCCSYNNSLDTVWGLDF